MLARMWRFVKRPPWRTVVPAVGLLLVVLLVRVIWSPGHDVTDGRHDLGRNGMWLQHGWIGADSWFNDNDKMVKLPQLRSIARVRELGALLRLNHITAVFPHLCPTQATGAIMPVDDRQAEMFVRELKGVRVLPWVGGVMDADVSPDNASRRRAFIQSIVALLRRHPALAGVQLNVEPWPSGHQGMLTLLEDLRRELPPGKVLSVAAYPPPTRWHPFPEVHWDEAYFKQVAARVDQMAVMMYDVALKDGKVYQYVMRHWTEQACDWTQSVPHPPAILLGVPTYDDAGSGYHNPAVENLPNALMGIHAGLDHYKALPPHYQGVTVYCEWETDAAEWRYWRGHFLKADAAN